MDCPFKYSRIVIQWPTIRSQSVIVLKTFKNNKKYPLVNKWLNELTGGRGRRAVTSGAEVRWAVTGWPGDGQPQPAPGPEPAGHHLHHHRGQCPPLLPRHRLRHDQAQPETHQGIANNKSVIFTTGIRIKRSILHQFTRGNLLKVETTNCLGNKPVLTLPNSFSQALLKLRHHGKRYLYPIS